MNSDSDLAVSKGADRDPPKQPDKAIAPPPQEPEPLALTRENMRLPLFWRQQLAVQTPHLKAAIRAYVEHNTPFLLNWTEFRILNEEKETVCEAKSGDLEDMEEHGHIISTSVNCGNCESMFAAGVQIPVEGDFERFFNRFAENYYGSLALTFEAHRCP